MTLTATPTDEAPWLDPVLDRLLDVPGLGLAIEVAPRITAVRPGTPAERAGLKPGDVLASLTLDGRENDPRQSDKPETLAFGPNDKESYATAFYRLQSLAPQAVTIQLANRDAAIRIAPEPAPDWNNPLHGLRYDSFVLRFEPLPRLGVAAAVRRGLVETSDTIYSIYAMFRSLATHEISPKTLGGPILIADVASKSARAGAVAFFLFLGVLSLNLAVINFLPIPPLDGGQMVFLIAEKILGRPLPEKALGAVTVAGLMLVLGLMSFVFYQDIVSLIRG